MRNFTFAARKFSAETKCLPRSLRADGILKSGDEIISINEQNVMGATHHHVVELMGQCGSNVSLLVRRKKDSDAFDVTLERDASEGFGFVIISCGNCALIGRIIDKSPAQRCQRLRIRDRIIAVNGQDITDLSHPDIVNMIKESGRQLRLKIIPSECYCVELCRGSRGFGFSIVSVSQLFARSYSSFLSLAKSENLFWSIRLNVIDFFFAFLDSLRRA